MKLGAFIKELRKEIGMTQKDLAERLHITDRAVSKWERGLCAPDISLLEPLCAILNISISELIMGERDNTSREPENINATIKNIIDYSENEIGRKSKTAVKKTLTTVVCASLILLLIIPTVNGLRGEGFSWRCISACFCAESAAKAIVQCDEQDIEKYIGNSNGMANSLKELEAEGVVISNSDVKLSRTRLYDMFLIFEVEFQIEKGDIKYLFTWNGTYRNGKAEFMNIANLGLIEDCPQWILDLSDVISTYDAG